MADTIRTEIRRHLQQGADDLNNQPICDGDNFIAFQVPDGAGCGTGMHSAMRADNDIDLYWDRERQNQFAQEYLDLCEEAERLRENVIRNIANITGTQYDLNTISQAYAKVIVRPKQEKTEKALTSAVIKMLAKAPPKREKKVLTPVSSEEMKKELLLKKQ